MKNSIFFLSAIILSLLVVSSEAHSLRITLKRVIFEGPKRAEVITVINNTKEAVTYRLGWKHFLMTENKSLVEVDEEAPYPAAVKPVKDMVRFAPRRFTIPPQSSQQVRMMLRTPPNLADGEYRSHLWVRPEASVEEIRKKMEKEKRGEGGGGVTVKMLAGVTMPVIVRKGSLRASAEVQNLQALQSADKVNVSYYIARSGNMSVYGDIDYICNEGSGGEYVLRNSKGNAIYAEAAGRNISLDIPNDPEQPSCQTLTVRYYETDEFMGKEVRLLSAATTRIN